MLNPDDFKSPFGKRVFKDYFSFLLPGEEENADTAVNVAQQAPVSQTSVIEAPRIKVEPEIQVTQSNNTETANTYATNEAAQEVVPGAVTETIKPGTVKEKEDVFNPFTSVKKNIEMPVVNRTIDDVVVDNQDKNDTNRPVVVLKDPHLIEKEQPSLDSRLTLHTFTKYLKNNGIIGEEKLGVLIPIILGYGGHVALLGDSGSGKSYVMKPLLKLFGDSVGTIKLTSGEGIWYQAEELNDKKILHFPEAQKGVTGKSKNNSFIELMKDLGEGEDAERAVTNSKRDGVDVYKFTKGKRIATTLAHEEAYELDTQLRRRLTLLETENSSEHIEKCIKGILGQKKHMDFTTKKYQIEQQLSERLAYMMDLKETYVINPFVDYFEKILPVTNKVQCCISHYQNVIDGLALAFSPERTSFEYDGKRFVLLNLEDIYNGHELFNDTFVNTLEGFKRESDEIGYFKPDWTDCLRQGFETASNDLLVKFDHRTINIGQELPEFIEEWRNNQMSGSKVYTVDYMTGENIEIADLDRPEHIASCMPIRQLPLGSQEEAEKVVVNPVRRKLDVQPLLPYSEKITDPRRLLPG